MPDIERLQKENLRLVQRLYDSFKHKEIDAILACLDTEVDWLFQGPAEIPFAGHFHGLEEVSLFFHTALASAEFMQFEPQEYMPSTNHVLVLGHEKVRARCSGQVWETDWAHVHTISGGKIVRMREYYDTAVMMQAFSGELSAVRSRAS